jgi:cobalt/nickel transport system permease protein
MWIFAPEDRSTVISGVDPRVRVVSAVAFSLLVVMFERWAALCASLSAVLLALGAARAFDRATLRRLGAVNLFVLFLLVFTPLSMPGTPLFRLGGLKWSADGILFGLRIGVKANTVMLLCSALLASMEPADLAHALYRLRLPAKLAHALFFCVRYLEVLHVEYHRLRNAMRLRAFRPRWTRHALRSLGYFVGMLFVRSVDRSDRILEAMKCRGFDGRLYSLAEFTPAPRDAVFAVAVAVTACGVAFLEWGL